MIDAQVLPTPRSLLRANEEPVLQAPVAGGPVFADDVWDLAVAGLPARVAASDARVDFGSIQDDHWRLLAKEYFWARLNETVPGSNRLPPQSARAELSAFVIFATWVLDPAAHPAGFDGRLSSLDHAQLDAFVQGLRDGRSAGTVGVYLRLVERLHDYSAFLSHDSLRFHPWRNRPSSRVAGLVRRGENKTPRIPQEVLGPFLRWALFYVEVASYDILAATDELAELRGAQASLLPCDQDLRGRLEGWLEGLRREGRAVPARPRIGQFDGPERDANLTAIAIECGMAPEALRHRPDLRELIGDAVVELGLEPWARGRQPTPHPAPLTSVTHTKPEVIGRLRCYVDRRRDEGRGIPCWSEWRHGMDGRLNYHLIAAQIGTAVFQRQHHPEAFAVLRHAAAELGLEPGGMDTPVSLDPATGRPWRARFGPNIVAAEADHLRAACYVVCAYLSGMRDGEIMEIRCGAYSSERSADGVINRHRVRSIVSKGRRVPEAATWVVSEHAARAIDVMERLDGGELVFGALRTRRVQAVNRLREHVNRLSIPHNDLAVPDVGGAPWRFDTRQFRRTLAWFIGAQPFGVWAGAVQFKHLSVRSAMEGIGPTVFEGYVGTAPSGFPTDVDLAREAAAHLYVENLAAAHAAGAASAGGGACRINARLDELRAELRDDGGPTVRLRLQVTDGQRRTAMLRSVSHNLFVGPLTDCFFDPDVALCLQDQDRSTATAPVIGRCRPEQCRNSRIGEHHLPTWEDRLAQIRSDLRTRDLPPLQRRHLVEQRDLLKAAIDSVRNSKPKSDQGAQG